MTLASWVTLLRCLGGPFIAYLLYFPQQWLLAAVIFAVFAATDWLDGLIARHTNSVTNFGKYMDPFADKVLVLTVFIALVHFQRVPLFGVLIILIRELAVMALRIIAIEKKKVIAASWSAKFKTFVQIASIFLTIIGWVYAPYVFWSAVLLTVYSFVEYVWINRKILSEK